MFKTPRENAPEKPCLRGVYVGSKTVQNRTLSLVGLLVCSACARPMASIQPVQVEVRFPACVQGVPAIEYTFVNPNSQPVTIHVVQVQIGLSEPESMSTLTDPVRHSIAEPQSDGLPEELLVPAFGRVQIPARFSYIAQFDLLKGEQYQIVFSAEKPCKRGNPRIVFPNPRVTFTTCE